MSGIFGFVCNNNKITYPEKVENELLSTPFLEKKDCYNDESVYISQISLKKNNIKKFEKNDIVIFIEGFIYNLSDINEIFNIKAENFSELLFVSYKEDILKKVLNKVNGHFTAVIYDKKFKKIFLMTDRWGLRFIYYYLKDDNFAFSGSVNCLLPLAFVDKEFDETAIKSFIGTQQHFFLDDNTYFKYIKLIKPSSLIEFDIQNKTFRQEYYWKYSEIKPSNISYKKAVDKIHDLFLQSMKRQIANINDEDICMGLSGGLDSRLCLAAMLELGRKPSYIYTMGNENSADVMFAKMVCNKFDLKHNIFDIKEKDNWLENRIKAISKVDGMLSVLDLHGSSNHKELAEHYTYCLNGYCGDAILGKTFKTNEHNIDTRMNERIAREFYGDFYEFSDYKNDYYNINHIEANLYAHRVRRYTTMGLVSANSFIEFICPFIDNDIIDFIFSIPDKYRSDNKLYEDMCLKYYRDLFRDIPWQNTMSYITGKLYKNKSIEGKIDNILFIGKRTKNLLKMICNPWSKICSYSFYDYNKLFHEAETEKIIDKIINKNAVFSKNIHETDIHKMDIKTLGAVISVESYVQSLKTKDWFN